MLSFLDRSMTVEAGFRVFLGRLNRDDADVQGRIPVTGKGQHAGDLQIPDDRRVVRVKQDARLAADQHAVALAGDSPCIPGIRSRPRAALYRTQRETNLVGLLWGLGLAGFVELLRLQEVLEEG